LKTRNFGANRVKWSGESLRHVLFFFREGGRAQREERKRHGGGYLRSRRSLQFNCDRGGVTTTGHSILFCQMRCLGEGKKKKLIAGLVSRVARGKRGTI